jgi:hypothetical protein
MFNKYFPKVLLRILFNIPLIQRIQSLFNTRRLSHIIFTKPKHPTEPSSAALLAHRTMSDYSHHPNGFPDMQHEVYPAEQYEGFWEQAPPQPSDYQNLQETDFNALLAGNINLQAEYSHPANANFATVSPKPFPDNSPIDEPSMYEYPPPDSPTTWAPQTFDILPNFQEPAVYRHPILAQFPSPTLPLRVIDRVGYPLGPHVTEALQLALNQRTQINPYGISKRKSVTSVAPAVKASPRSPIRPVKNPLKPWVKPNLKTAGKNGRPANIQSFDATKVYDKLPHRPHSWGIQNHLGVHPFRYTADGELLPDIKFTQELLLQYLTDHPGHLAHGEYNTKSSGLIIWVQSVPADSAARYATEHSDKCRNVDCPVPNGTIHKGHYRVAFDEQSWSNSHLNLDPYNNAGYMHLYCFEKMIDFPQFCKDFNIQPDTRVFPNEKKNRMAVTRDNPEMRNIVQDYINNQPQWDTFSNPYRYEETLSYRLTKEHIRAEPAARRAIRSKRGGNTIDKHLNNLEVYIAGNKQVRTKQGRAQRNANELADSRPARKTSAKRRRSQDDSDDSDSEFELDGNVLAMNSSAPVLRKRQRR